MTANNPDKTHKQPPAVKKVVDYIANLIYTNQLQSGDRVPTEAELCETLGISRTPVREALKYLESQTVLRTKQGSGTFVVQPEEISITMPLNFRIKLEQIPWVEIVDFRNQMEFLILREAIRTATDEDIRELDEITRRTAELRRMKPLPVEETRKLELEFHEKLLSLAENRLLKDMYTLSSQIFNPMITKLYTHKSEGIDESEFPFSHSYFVDAIRQRDVMYAYQVTMHLIPTERFKSFLGYEEYSPELEDGAD